MTISSTTRTASFTGNGAASTFAFAFMVFAPSDVLVVETNSTTGAEQTMVLNTDYSVTLNADQNDYPGGSITLLAGALANGYTLVITSSVPNTQNTDLSNSGGFYPEVITAALDKLTVLVQQLQQQINQANGYGETIATNGQTVFTVPTYALGSNTLLVVCGGLLLTNGLDYTETNTQRITLTQAAAAGEVYTFRVLN